MMSNSLKMKDCFPIRRMNFEQYVRVMKLNVLFVVLSELWTTLTEMYDFGLGDLLNDENRDYPTQNLCKELRENYLYR